MSAPNPMITIETGIARDKYGYVVRAKVGSGATARREAKRFPMDATLPDMRAWRLRALAALQGTTTPKATRGTLAADVVEYLRIADITAATKKRREQQLKFWAAQPAAVGGAVLSVEDIAAGKVATTRTLGQLRRVDLEPKRIREILADAFAAPPKDPTLHASTSNHYRTALFHLFTTLDQDDADAVNPVSRVKVRPQAQAKPSGQDPRIIREILRHVESGHGAPPVLSALRLAVLAWVHITPTQLMGIDPALDFHDVPDATPAEIRGGAITLTIGARLKGRKDKPIPAPITIPLNPYGAAAMRAFAANPDAHGHFSVSPLNRIFKRAARVAQAILAERGITSVDGAPLNLSGVTLYHLKHSLAGAASQASDGLVDRRGVLRQSPGVQRALDHADARTTATYTAAAIDPQIRRVNAETSIYLERMFRTPLTAPLKLAKRRTA